MYRLGRLLNSQVVTAQPEVIPAHPRARKHIGTWRVQGLHTDLQALLRGAVTQNVPREIDFRAKSCNRKDRSDPVWEQADEADIFSMHPSLSGTVGFNSTLRWGSSGESSKERHEIDPGARKRDKRFLSKGMSDSSLHVGNFSVAYPKAQCLELKVRQIQPYNKRQSSSREGN